MKKRIKIISLILSIAMLASASTVFASALTFGDINGDNKVKANDARILLRYVSSIDTIDEALIPYLDLNGDGKIKAADARVALRAAAGLEDNINIYSSYFASFSDASQGYEMAMSGKDMYINAELDDMSLGLIFWGDGKLTLINTKDKSYCTPSQEDIAALNDLGLNLGDLSAGISELELTLYKLSSFDVALRTELIYRDKEAIVVEFESKQYVFDAETKLPVAILNADGTEMIRFDTFSVSATKYFTFGSDYTQVTDLMEFLFSMMPNFLN